MPIRVQIRHLRSLLARATHPGERIQIELILQDLEIALALMPSGRTWKSYLRSLVRK
ncbi:MAG: hypothetical protein HC878_00215 [Leptolyngbyaceae cyanobacterium SL_5_14]|nr:hypothetical protein [Leptolyngbyaceae cyanobacterium SL_5_14]